MTKIRFLGRSCIELIDINDHIIIDPNYFVSPENGIKTIFLTHKHSDHANMEKISEIRNKYAAEKLKIYAPKIMREKLEIKVVKDEEVIELEDLSITPYKIKCYKTENCFAYLIKKGDITLLHTADSAYFSKSLMNLVSQVDYCFIASFEEFYGDYLKFLNEIYPKIVFPYHFDPGQEEMGKKLVKFLNEQEIDAKFLEIGADFEF
jgi:L-ascorbate metabolism protein UlaG (beta-lactamase superfamily)